MNNVPNILAELKIVLDNHTTASGKFTYTAEVARRAIATIEGLKDELERAKAMAAAND